MQSKKPSLVGSTPKKRFPQVDIGECQIGWTSNPEFEKLKYDPIMEKLRDRIVKVDIPLLKEWQAELELKEKNITVTRK